MCIAILKPADKKIHKDVLDECYRMNRDGAGFAFHDPVTGKVNYKKGYFDFESFWKDYEKYQDYKCLIHFRVATHKNVDAENCHPWRVNRNLVFIHNGKIAGMDKDETISDTGNFCVMLGELLEDAPEYYKTPEFKWFTANAIGSGNKLVFLDSSGNHVIVNESAGNWKDGVWFSNLSYGCKRSREKGVLTDECYPAQEPKQELQKTPPSSVNVQQIANKPDGEFVSSSTDPQALIDEVTKNGFAYVDVASESEIDRILGEVNRLQFSK